VLDLRQNAGGSEEAMLKSVALMVPDETTIAISADRDGKEAKLQASGTPVFSPIPLAILIGGETACGAEIMAEALKVDLGATLVGSRTQGKWNAQSIEEFPNHAAMKYTVAILKGPNGENFDGVGIMPDVEVASGQGKAYDMALARATQLVTHR
jgi:carboxyl-terminal processing protease